MIFFLRVRLYEETVTLISTAGLRLIYGPQLVSVQRKKRIMGIPPIQRLRGCILNHVQPSQDPSMALGPQCYTLLLTEIWLIKSTVHHLCAVRRLNADGFRRWLEW